MLLSVFGANAVSFGGAQWLAPQTFHVSAAKYGLVGIYFAALLAGAFAPGRRLTLAALLLLLGLYALDLVFNVTGG